MIMWATNTQQLAILILPFTLTVRAGVTVTASETGASTAPTSSLASATSSASSCDYSGSVSNFIDCTKKNISTGVLIGAGIGITLGIFIIAFGCIWCLRSRRRPKTAEQGETNDEGKEVLEDGQEKETPLSEKQVYERRRLAATVEDVSDTETTKEKRPKRQSQHAGLGGIGSPVQVDQVRNLYPTNPSPNPRLSMASTYKTPPQVPSQPMPPSAMARRSNFSRPGQPTASMYGQSLPPVPDTRPPTVGGTPPLNIKRQSSASTIIPSYYGGSSRKPSNTSGRGSDSSGEVIPPLPAYSARPSGGEEGRRPSHGGSSRGGTAGRTRPLQNDRRPSDGSGGMI
ncbi:hypothetical protein P7C73_g5320, partial [Tremellales sp. Uapishka_1]